VNASSSIDRIDSGKTTLFRRQQFLKVPIGMSGIGPWINISSSDEQFKKALSPSVVSEGGRWIVSSDEQSQKALSPSVVSEGGRSIFWSDEQL